jgi:methyl-accepting chemotaxis protein
MNWFKNLKTKSKLLLGFGVQCAVLVGVAIMAYGTLATIQETERTVDHSNRAAMALVELRSTLNRIRARMFELFLTTDESGKAALKRDIDARIEDVKETVDQVNALLTPRRDAEVIAAIGDLKRRLAIFLDGRAEVARLLQDGRKDAGLKMLMGIQGERFEGVRDLAIKLDAGLLRDTEAQAVDFGRLLSLTVRVFVAAAIATMVFALSMVWLMNRLIAAPLKEVTEAAGRVAAGDLTVRVEAEDRSDEVGVLLRALGTMVQNLRGTNREIRDGVGLLASSSSEILSTVSQVAASVSETATAVTETSTTVEEVKQTAHLSNQKAKAVKETAQKAAAVSEPGLKNVTVTVEGMSRIREQMESIAESVVRLSEQGQAIGEIIATVNDLAEQSNLLAVNAAIEATRAGEYGKGFAVVAQGVKSLADQSRQATTQVRTILMEVQKATSAAVMATEQGTKAVAAGVKQATDAGESIRALTGNVREAAEAAIQIAASSQEQLAGMDQIASAIAHIRQAAVQNTAGTQQLETSAKNLQGLGGRLKVLVERQRLEG